MMMISNHLAFVEVRNRRPANYVRKELILNIASTSRPAPRPQPNKQPPKGTMKPTGKAGNRTNAAPELAGSSAPTKNTPTAKTVASTTASSSDWVPYTEESSDSAEVFDWEGRRVQSMHELESDDIVNKFITNENGAHVAFVKKRHQIKSYIAVARLGRNLQREDDLNVPAISFTDPCLVALPGVKRTLRWYNFNKEIFYLNVGCFFDPQAKINVDYWNSRRLAIIEENASTSIPFVETCGDKAINGGKGYLVTNMYEMGYDDVITMLEVNEKGKTIAYAWETDQIPKGVNIVKLGPKLEELNGDDNGVNFTEDFLLSCPEVKKKGDWYDFDKPAFILRVLSFFDPNLDRNKKYLKEMRRRARKEKRRKKELILKMRFSHRTFTFLNVFGCISVSFFNMLIKIATWNVRGLKKPSKHNTIKNFTRINNINLFCFLETKMNPNSFNNYVSNVWPEWVHETNFQTIQGGRMGIIWDPGFVICNFLEIDKQHMHIKCTCRVTQTIIYATFVYPLYTVLERKELWDHLMDLGAFIFDPWVICGDFNCVCSPNERVGPTPPPLGLHYATLE
ncbi:unnamed protein product [Cuscuta epithymum]|uniref:Endonuclease/exonuclease/phosphatase domain-containing protein n=1 Tax=Cuscuta epithymum TaxID=186058 RepID=A0AAV0CQE4_9ASTE|nr:unnamed protein product [Cuscuta epithymum]